MKLHRNITAKHEVVEYSSARELLQSIKVGNSLFLGHKCVWSKVSEDKFDLVQLNVFGSYAIGDGLEGRLETPYSMAISECEARLDAIVEYGDDRLGLKDAYEFSQEEILSALSSATETFEGLMQEYDKSIVTSADTGLLMNALSVSLACELKNIIHSSID